MKHYFLMIFAVDILLSQHSKSSVVNKRIFRLKEETSIGTKIGNIFDDLQYSKLNLNVEDAKIYTNGIDKNYTRLDLKGNLRVNRIIDREKMCPTVEKIDGCELELLFQFNNDMGIKVVLIIEDINDNKPKFSELYLKINLSEGTNAGYQLPLKLAIDEDLDYHGIQSYRFKEASPYFSLLYNPQFSLYFVIIKKLDYENESNRMFNLTMIACDGGDPVHCANQNLYVYIHDVNDNKPVFSRDQYYVTVNESHKVGSSIFQFKAVDVDSGLFGLLKYVIIPGRIKKYKRFVKLDGSSGDLILINRLNAKATNKFMVNVEARDENGYGPYSSICRLTVTISDNNDHAPKIRLADSSAGLSVKENLAAGEHVGMLIVSDDDLGENSMVKCLLTQINTQLEPLVALDSPYKMKDDFIFRLVTVKILDREKLSYFTITINCHDMGKPQQRSKEYFNVTILDDNEFPPQFIRSNYSIGIEEDIPIGTDLLTVKATDRDGTEFLCYYLSEETLTEFNIHSKKGILSNKIHLDRETKSQYQFKVFVTDTNIKNNALTGSTIVQITLFDVNDNAPIISGTKRFTVNENEPVSISGNYIGSIKTYDPDKGENSTVVCLLDSVNILHEKRSWRGMINSPFKMTNCLLYNTNHLDRETVDQYKLNVIVSDMGIPSRSSMEVLTVDVLDENDNSPQWMNFFNQSTYTVNVTDEMDIDKHSIFQVFARDTDASGNANISYHFFSQNPLKQEWYLKYFNIKPFDGRIYLDKKLMKSGSYILKIRASDNGQPIRYSSIITLIINVPKGLRHFTGYYDNRGDLVSGAGSNTISLTLIVATSLASFCVCIALMIGIVLMWRRSTSNGSPSSSSAMTGTGGDIGPPYQHQSGYIPYSYISSGYWTTGNAADNYSGTQKQPLLINSGQNTVTNSNGSTEYMQSHLNWETTPFVDSENYYNTTTSAAMKCISSRSPQLANVGPPDICNICLVDPNSPNNNIPPRPPTVIKDFSNSRFESLSDMQQQQPHSNNIIRSTFSDPVASSEGGCGNISNNINNINDVKLNNIINNNENNNNNPLYIHMIAAPRSTPSSSSYLTTVHVSNTDIDATSVDSGHAASDYNPPVGNSEATKTSRLCGTTGLIQPSSSGSIYYPLGAVVHFDTPPQHTKNPTNNNPSSSFRVKHHPKSVTTFSLQNQSSEV